MADIYVYGTIGEGWDEGAITANRFAWLMQQASGEDVTIHINSCGGDVFDANAMAETIRAYKGNVTASIEGLAASAASYFALTADRVEMNPSALLMIHNPWGLCQGDSADMRKTADMLDKVRETIVGQYVRRTGMQATDVAELMDKETWFGAQEALELGFVDELTEAMPIAACATADALSRFKNKPADLAPATVEPPAQDCQKAAAEPAGDMPSNIGDNARDETQAGAAGVAAEAATRVECVNGRFIKHKE